MSPRVPITGCLAWPDLLAGSIYHPIYLSIRAWGVVDQGVLQQRPEHEEDADAGPHVDGLGVGHGGQGVVDAGLDRKSLENVVIFCGRGEDGLLVAE